jgi:hypothetical protein
MGRLRHGDLIAGAGGLALIASLFLHWYGLAIPEGFTALAGVSLAATGWQAFGVLDVVLALLALVPLALVVLQATRESPSVPVAFSVLCVPAGLLATLLILYRIVNQPGENALVEVRAGAWVGLLAAVVVTAGGWRSLRDESIPHAPLPPVEQRPTPPAGVEPV